MRAATILFPLVLATLIGVHTPALASEGLRTALDGHLAAAEADGFSGQILVADASGIVYERELGHADPATAAPVAADTRFNLASTGKLFTTVAVLQLVQAGKLDLDAPVGRYLPDWPVATVREQVTARQLLSHTSGLGAYWGEDFARARPGLQRLDDYRALIAQEPDFAPGSGWAYSNSGYVLLGLLVEAVSGEDYYDYVVRHVFQPAGMRNSGYFAVDGQADRVATPHAGGTGDDRDQVFPMPEPRGGAAGGGYSTARDLLAFHRALTGGALVDEARLDLLFAPIQLPAGTRAPPHGLGLIRYDVANDVAYGHPGGAPGVAVDLRALRKGGWAVVVLSNSSNVATMRYSESLLGAIADAGGPDLRLMRPRGGAPSTAR
jgi:D-alanyl-D-alanine carboxypeptidase